MVHVIGAGVTGLAFAKCYRDEYRILESKKELGGKALSYKVETNKGDFGFDIGGHWFHHKSAPETLELLNGLELEEHRRYAYVYLDDQFFEYPIQQSYKAHLNPFFVFKVERELRSIKGNNHSYAHYDDMLKKSYGPTLYDSFFRNYNMKMYGVKDLSQINVGSYEKIRNLRTLGGNNGYNVDFVYPKGDIGAKGIPLFLARNLNISYNQRVEEISLSKKTATVNGQVSAWKKIVSTMPLTSLVNIISDVDPKIVEMANRLKSSKGLIVNLGVKRNPLHGQKSWIYVPSLDYCFYRIGFYSNVQPLLAPKGYVSMYVECSPLFFKSKMEAIQLIPRVIDELVEIGIIKGKEEIVTSHPIYLEHNYCLPDEEVSNEIIGYLEKFDIYSIGRYGTWHWSSQHEDMKQAINLAAKFKEESTASI